MTRVTQKTMRAAAIDRFGGLEELKLQTVPVPEIGPNDVLIRIESAGVAEWDPFEREGGFVELAPSSPRFPYVLGSDGAGTVVAVGDNVKRFKEGDRVYAAALANPKGGFYAEYAAVNADTVSRVPDKLTTEQAGAMPSDALTALLGLDDVLGMKRGETLMIFGASGGIGHMAVQLAKRMGARVFAVASGADGTAMARELGADTAVDGRQDDVMAAAREFAPRGLDAALMTAGGEIADNALAAVRNGGRAAYPNGVMPEPQAPAGVRLQSYDLLPALHQKTMEKLNRLIEAGPFEVHVARTFPLHRAADAQRALDDHYLGKLALQTA